MAVKTFADNPYDGNTIEPLLKQMEHHGQELPREIIYDCGGKEKRFRSRAGIEPIIRHLKNDFGLEENYLHGVAGMQINALLPCTAWNLKKLIEVLKEQAARLFLRLFIYLFLLPFGRIILFVRIDCLRKPTT